MIIFEYVRFSQLYVAERTSMMPIDALKNAFLAIYVPATSNVAIFDLAEAYITQKLFLEFSSRYFEVSVVHLRSNYKNKNIIISDIR